MLLVKGANYRVCVLYFRLLDSTFAKFFVSVLKWQVTSFSNFALFFIVMTRNFIVIFKVIHFILWIKRSYKSPNFDSFRWSAENLLNIWCHFSNSKLVFLQILHHSWMYLKITHLHFFSSNITDFGHTKLIKTHFFFLDFQVLGSIFVEFLISALKKQVNLSSILYHSSLSWHITPL